MEKLLFVSRIKVFPKKKEEKEEGNGKGKSEASLSQQTLFHYIRCTKSVGNSKRKEKKN